MRTQVKIVKLIIVLCALFAVLTYFITLNMEIGFINLHTPWLSNNFALTVCGGAFSGVLVMLVCEIQKYLLMKADAENLIYTHTAYIFVQLHIIQSSIQSCVSNPNQNIPGQLLAHPAGIVRNEVAIISNADYVTLLANNLVNEYQNLCRTVLPCIEKYMVATPNLEIAVRMDQINNLQIFGVERPITSQSNYTHKTLDILSKEIVPLQEKVDSFLCVWNDKCKNRYQWPQRRDAMLADYRASSPSGFEEFMKQGSVQ